MNLFLAMELKSGYFEMVYHPPTLFIEYLSLVAVFIVCYDRILQRGTHNLLGLVLLFHNVIINSILNYVGVI